MLFFYLSSFKRCPMSKSMKTFFKKWIDLFRNKLVKSYKDWFLDGDLAKPSPQQPASSHLLHQEKIFLKSVPLSKAREGAMIYASQLPVHLFPWVAALKSGVYQIGFPPAVQSQINSGMLNVTGGVARSSGGQIVAHGQSLTPLAVAAPIVLYQIGVMVFGASYLQKINRSLKKITEKLNTIYAFQLDKRTAQINSYFQEYSHLSKGILEFQKLGNVAELLKRIDTIKQLRLMNLSHLLHLQKNLHNEGEQLKDLESSDWVGSKNSTQSLKEAVGSYTRHLMDYKHSLFLDIIFTKTETCFSVFKSREETTSRVLQQKNQLKDFNKQFSSFENSLHKKTIQMINSYWNFEGTKRARREEVKEAWTKVKNIVPDFNNECLNHIKDTENRVKPHGQYTLFLNKTNVETKNQKPSPSDSDSDNHFQKTAA